MEKYELTYQQILKWWSSIRWYIVIVLFSIGMLRIHSMPIYIISAFLVTFAGTVILNLFFHVQIINENRFFCSLQILLDILFSTIIVHLTGGIESPFVWSYIVAVVTASLTVEKTGGILAGLIGSMALMALLLLYNFDVITFLNKEVSYDTSTMTTFLLSYTGLFTGIAFISNYISDFIKSMLKKEQEVISQNTQQEIFINEMIIEHDNHAKEIDKYRSIIPIAKDLSHLDHDINTPLCVISLSLTRVKQAAAMLKNNQLAKSGNEITEAVNDITTLLKRLKPLKEHELIKEKRKEA